MRVLDRKLLRDLWRLRGQMLAIALVVASGVATHVIARSVIDSLQRTREGFYRSANFADIFVSLRRAPDAVATDLASIPGVRRLETRVSTRALLEVPDFAEPVSALVLSLPAGANGLNRLYLRSGRLPESDREVAVNEAFAQAHGFVPGSRLSANINGRKRELSITGIALSAEFTYLMRPGDFLPDYKRYGVLWMPREPLAAAAGMQDAFNDVVLTIDPQAVETAVIAAVDRQLMRWGGAGAFGRDLQTSNRFLSDEIRQNQRMAQIIPFIFLSVAAFLLNVVLSRLLAQERMQVAVLKAFGYGTPAIAGHYLKLSGLVILVGSVIGLLAGARLGIGQAALYSEFYRFPQLHYVLRPQVASTAVAVSAVAALSGALIAVLRAARLSPAAGMRPEEPPRFHRMSLDRGLLHRLLSPPAHMALRNIRRRPLKSALTVVGIALAVAVLVLGGFMWSAVQFMIEVQFNRALRADLTLTFTEIAGHEVLHELAGLPGVRRVEPFRATPVKLHRGPRVERLALQGMADQGRLYRTLNERYAAVSHSGGGLMLTDHLARKLGVGTGDRIDVELLDGRRRTLKLTVTGVVGELVGHNAYMSLDALNAWLGDGDVVSGAFLQVDADARDAFNARIRKLPRVIGIMDRKVAKNSFNDTMGENVLIFSLVNLCLAATIAVGVVYNSMRTALSERAHELASLRVLGYTRAEAAYVLLGEIVTLTLIAIPTGMFIGFALCGWVAHSMDSDLFRVPLVVAPRSYASAATAIIAATAASALVMVQHIRRVDLVSALKVPQ